MASERSELQDTTQGRFVGFHPQPRNRTSYRASSIAATLITKSATPQSPFSQGAVSHGRPVHPIITTVKQMPLYLVSPLSLETLSC